MSLDFTKLHPKLKWLDGENVRPYILVRSKNTTRNPGSYNKDFHWFSELPVIVKNPLQVAELEFSDLIMDIEGRAFHEANMGMPRWVFYDCAIMPGVVAGFAHRTSTLPEKVRKAINRDIQGEWTPLSLFIIIPTQRNGEWVAHNLMSINSLLDKEGQFYGMGFLSKAYGLWYSNVEKLCGMTQWGSPALKLHSNYGDIKLLTAYTPVHSYAKTVTYQCYVNANVWESFFTKKFTDEFEQKFKPTGLTINMQDTESLKHMQSLLEKENKNYFLSPEFIRSHDLKEPIPVYVKK